MVGRLLNKLQKGGNTMYNKIPRKSIKKIAVVLTDCKKSLQQVVAEQKCQYVIDGGLYKMKTVKLCPIPLRVNGKTLANQEVKKSLSA